MEAGGGLPPKSKPPTPKEQEQVSVAGHKAAKIWSGVKTLNEWIDSGEPPVVQELASSRAFVCSRPSHWARTTYSCSEAACEQLSPRMLLLPPL